VNIILFPTTSKTRPTISQMLKYFCILWNPNAHGYTEQEA